MKTKPPFHALLLISGFAAVSLQASAGNGQGTAPPATDGSAVIREYCLNISDQAAEARAGWLAANMNRLRDDVTAKIAELEVKRLDVQGWVEKQQAMLQAANRDLVDIYAKMDSESAAAQLGRIDIRTAVSILRQLNPRNASAILDVMEPDKAAVLVKAIAAVIEDKKPGKGS